MKITVRSTSKTDATLSIDWKKARINLLLWNLE